MKMNASGKSLPALSENPRTKRSMITCCLSLLLLLLGPLTALAADRGELQERRHRLAAELHDGILLVRATSQMDAYEDGLHQTPEFFYLTGLENTLGAFLAIDGASGESWLFLSSTSIAPGSHISEIAPGPESEKLLGIDHVVDLSALQQFLMERTVASKNLYYISPFRSLKEMPTNILGPENANAPLWAVVLAQKWPAFHLKDATQSMHAVMAVQSADEVAALRSAGRATASAMMASLKVVRPGESPRTVELAVVDNCWKAGAHGVSYWPFIMAGENGVVPKVYASYLRYDHLDTAMHAGDLIHFDIGCESNHYNGDLGRTIPVSGHFTDDQRETWNLFIAADRAAVSVFRDGVTEDQVFDAWRTELLRHRASAKSSLAQRAIDSWSKRENDPFWSVHYTHLFPAYVKGPLHAGTVIGFEPVATMDGQGYYLEDMYRITQDGAELLTPGIPYTAEEIEAAMR